MPKKNQRSVTLRQDIYELAQENALKEGKSVAGFVTDLIAERTKEAE